MDSPPRMKWTLYITIASIFIFISLTEVGPFQSLASHNIFSHFCKESHHKYAIMFDGGSTGTRMHVFTFVNNSDALLTLKDEYFEEVKPGLSYFAYEPHLAADSVSKLLEKVKVIVPSSKWEDTPVALKATAGLRLLPAHMSDDIIEEISLTLKDSPFISDENSVSVLDGQDEGLYAWFTLNFLLGRLDNASKSVVAFDLGGGSTQVTFLPVDFNTFVFSPKEYIVNAKIFNRTFTVYTHSYLGQGLMTARLGIMKLSGNYKDSQSENMTFFTPCVPPAMKSVWNWNQKEYIIRGSNKEKYGFETCYDLATHFLEGVINQPAELRKREIYVLSYYLDRAIDLGIVGKHGGLSTVGEFTDACQRTCSKQKLLKLFSCLDCSYISALFSYSFGFDSNKTIMFTDNIDGKETSWALGLAFTLLQ